MVDFASMTIDQRSLITELASLSQNMVKHFEILYLVSLKYTGDDLQKVMDDVKKVLTDNEATITKEENLGKQKLAYPINHVHQGTYVCLEFDAPGLNLKKMETLLLLNKDVLRFMIVHKKIKTAEEIEREQKIQDMLLKQKEEELSALVQGDKKPAVVREEVKETVVEPEVKEEPVQADDTTVIVKEEPVAAPVVEEVKEIEIKTKKAKGKVSLEDLDKKLDEILTDEII